MPKTTEHYLRQAWVDLVYQIALAPISGCFQERKFVKSWQWEVDGDVWNSGLGFGLEEIGYHGNDSKLNQLTRTYLNVEELEQAKKKLRERIDAGQIQSAVAVPMQAGDKDERSQGHCIQSMVLTHYKHGKGKDEIYIDLFYRSTEILKKFLADLIFLSQVVIPKTLKGLEVYPLKTVTFYFANIFLSPLFLPVFYRLEDPITFLEKVREEHEKNDFWTYPHCFTRTKTLLEKDYTHYNYRSRREMHKLAQEAMDEGRIDRPKLKKYIKNHAQDAKYRKRGGK